MEYDDYDYYESQEEPVEQKISPSAKWNSKFGRGSRRGGISFDDLLSSMSMHVIDGKLQLIPTNSNLVNRNGGWTVNPYTQQPIMYENGMSQSQSQSQQQGMGMGMGRPGVGQQNNLYIQQPHQQTPQMRQQAALQHFIKVQEARKNANATKSKRMMFSEPSHPLQQMPPPAAPPVAPQPQRLVNPNFRPPPRINRPQPPQPQLPQGNMRKFMFN
jgi:hypothetical protein